MKRLLSVKVTINRKKNQKKRKIERKKEKEQKNFIVFCILHSFCCFLEEIQKVAKTEYKKKINSDCPEDFIVRKLETPMDFQKFIER